MNKFIKIHQADNVVVATEELQKATVITVDDKEIVLGANIPLGHKIAIAPIAQGEEVLKYSYVIGAAKEDIAVGAHVHTHNVRTLLDENLSYKYEPQLQQAEPVEDDKTFQGYARSNGEVGIRNEFWIVPTVGCVNGQSKMIMDRIKAELDTEHLDALEVLNHQYGCSQLGDDHSNTRKALAAAIKHPNAGAVLVLGLGCENNQVAQLKEEMGDFDADRIQFLVAQEVEDEVESGFELAKQLIEMTRKDKRSTVPVSKLKIGLKCGGSDAFSGITANPLLGEFTDWFVARGGTTVLTEVPEMFGAETILMNRAKDVEVFDKTVELINSFKDYFRKNDQTIYENPSPGNKEGGITTLEDKSLGAIQKGGTATVVDVLNYGECVKKPGLNLLWSPGNDLVSSSALGMSGCHMVLFTTGRGTPFGSFVPTLKVASNTPLFERKSKWMDFNAGTVLEENSFDTAKQALIDKIIATAEGAPALHEKYDNKEIAIFKSGVTL